MSEKANKTKKSGRAIESLIAVSGNNLQSSNVIEFYYYEEERWAYYTELETYRRRSRCVVYEGKLLLIGGETKGIYTSDVDSYDLIEDEYRKLPSIPEATYDCALVVHSGYVYMIGGISKDSVYLTNIVRYSSSSNYWETMTPMTTARRNCAAVPYNQEIFIIGGNSGQEALSDVQAYNPSTQSFRTCASMNEKRNGVSAAALGGYIYAFGGFDGTKYLKTTERYDPVSNSWTYTADSNWARGNTEAVNYEDSIVVAGGMSTDDGYNAVNFVEQYDETTERFTKFASMRQPRINFSLLSVPFELDLPPPRKAEENV